MKALTLWSSPYKGGCARRFVELAEGLSACGTDVVVLTRQAYPRPGAVRTEAVRLPGGRFRAARMLLTRRCDEQVKMIVSQQKPSVVFAFGLAVNGPLEVFTTALCPCVDAWPNDTGNCRLSARAEAPQPGVALIVFSEPKGI